jgi:trehalose-6-phosphate synthase
MLWLPRLLPHCSAVCGCIRLLSVCRRCGLFLHSPFPSSEIFRTFPKREELLRSMLNADLIGEPG